MNGLALWALALFVFSIPSESGPAVAGIGSLSRMVGLVAFGLFALSWYDRGRLRFRMPTVFLLLAVCFVGWSATTYFWSVAPSMTMSRSLQFLQLLVFAWMLHQLARGHRERDFLMQAYVLGSIVAIAIAIASYVGSARGGYRDVVFSINSFAAMAAVGIPMAWSLLLRVRSPVLRVLNAVYPVLALAAVVMSASRGGLVTAAVALAIIPLTLPDLGFARRLLVVAVLTATVLSAFTWLPAAVPDLEQNLERLRTVDDEILGGGTLSGRTEIWSAGLRLVAEAPLGGVGAGAYARAVEPILGRGRAAHNAFLSVAATTGLVGLALFVGMFGVVAFGCLSRGERRREYLVLLAAVVVAILPLNHENNKYVWFVLGLLSSARPITIWVGAMPWSRRARAPRAAALARSEAP